jgi:hypothetical protein
VADDFGATPIDVARDWQRLDILDMLAGTLSSICAATETCSRATLVREWPQLIKLPNSSKPIENALS